MGAVVHINVSPKRLLNLQDAAGYVDYGTEKFKALCPVKPIEMPCGQLKFDIADLDTWIEIIKKKTAPSAEDFLERLQAHD